MKILKDGNLMVVTDDFFNIDSNKESASGIYLEDTRFISEMALKTNFKLKQIQNHHSWNKFTTRYLSRDKPTSTHYNIEITEKGFVQGNRFYIDLLIRNFSKDGLHLSVSYFLKYTYEDIFSVRSKNETYMDISKDTLHSEKELFKDAFEDELTKYYVDNKLPEGSYRIKPGESLKLKGRLYLKKEIKKKSDFKEILEDRATKFNHDPERFYNDIVRNAIEDLRSLMIPTVFGDFPGAGLPWFATIFGRDSIIFALQTLKVFPEIAKTVILVHSYFQATEEDNFTDATPGKIVHEIRLNPLSLSNKLPFTSYYGNIDGTLLYLVLVGEYLNFTKDIETINRIKANIAAAECWIERYADIDNDGYIEYSPSSETSLTTQGWKDSEDSIHFSNGKLAEAPIALVEVQGYLYLAYLSLMRIYKTLDDSKKSKRYEQLASKLKERFNHDFWLSEEKYFAMALDKDKKRVDAIGSNPGHCLYAGIISEEKARYVVSRLLSDDLYTGWGIRTLSKEMSRYNPYSYHNGTVWPHDNSLSLLGLMKYGFKTEAVKLANSLLEATEKLPNRKLPELFCGLSRKESDDNVVVYPTSCSPQLWSLGTIFTIYEILSA
ncbi:MAG: amylo-alpha-1,6-glucosidase [Kosmotogaceae bacterium]